MSRGFTVVIPARFGSSRFPGKPLHHLAGQTMIERVAQRGLDAGADQVIVATDDLRIAEQFRDSEVRVAMTREDHQSGTDRIYEAVQMQSLPAEHVVVNVQGDEPLIPPAVIRQAAALVDQNVQVATLYEAIRSREEVFDPNAVKVVVDHRGEALYFSRAPVPVLRNNPSLEGADGEAVLKAGLFKRHIGIYAYTVGLLSRFVSWPPAALEQAEHLEQLRLLANGVRIRIDQACETVPAGIDTPADAARVEALLSG